MHNNAHRLGECSIKHSALE